MHTALEVELQTSTWNSQSLTSFFVSLFASVCRRVLLATAVAAARAAAPPAFYQDAAIHLRGHRYEGEGDQMCGYVVGKQQSA